MKKRVLIDHPYLDARGQYVFLDDEADAYSESNSVPVRHDKFLNKDLYAISKGNDINEHIIEGDLRFSGTSFITIDELKIGNNGVSHDINHINTYVFLFDNNRYNPISKTYTQLYTKLFTDSDKLSNDSMIYKTTGQSRDEGKGLGTIIKNSKIVSNLYTGGSYHDNFPNAVSTYNPNSAIGGSSPDDGLLLDFTSTGTSAQTIYVVVYTSGDAIRWWGTDNRRSRIHIFEIDTGLELVDGDDYGDITEIPFTYGQAIKKEGGGGSGGAEAPAFKVNSLKLKFNTVPETSEEVDVPIRYSEIVDSIQRPMKIDVNQFDLDIIKANPYRELQSATTGDNATISSTNFTPIPNVTVLDDAYTYNLQLYYTSSIDRQIASAPTQISLDYDIADFNETTTDYDLSIINNTSNYKFYVLSWDDVDDDFEIWEDILDDIPKNNFELLDKQDKNLYNYTDIGTSLTNQYTTPGIKTIKSVLFSYDISETKIEPIRWKFITARLFLDIPVSQFPDFVKLGGADFVTLPWPHTTPIISGISQDSKYIIGVSQALAGGKLADTDIIDETLLSDALDNDELGENYGKSDLEQVRYFSTGSYDMATLLGISVIEELSPVVEIISPKIQDLPGYETFAEPQGGPGSAETPIRAYQNPYNNGPGLDVSAAAQYCNDAGYDSVDMSQTMQYRIPHSTVGNDSYMPFYWLHPGAGWTFAYDVSQDTWGSDLEVFGRIFCVATNPSGLLSHTNTQYWDCRDWKDERNYCFPQESSVGQIFISDNIDSNLKRDCEFEFNCGSIDGNTIYDSSGNGSKGVLIGDFTVKKDNINRPIRRNSYIKVPKTGRNDGVL